MNGSRAFLVLTVMSACCLGAAGCPDAVREGAVMGVGSLTQSAITIPLAFFNVGLEVLQEVLIAIILGGI